MCRRASGITLLGNKFDFVERVSGAREAQIRAQIQKARIGCRCNRGIAAAVDARETDAGQRMALTVALAFFWLSSGQTTPGSRAESTLASATASLE